MDEPPESNLKQLSNPISTGGGGVTFEQLVQSVFVVLMLTRGVAPCLPPWPITQIKVQGKNDGYETDDFIAIATEPNTNREAKLLVQVKRYLRVTAGDEIFAEVIKAMWEDYRSSSFDRGLHSLALITGPINHTDSNGVRQLLQYARTSHNSSDFFHKVTPTNIGSQTHRTKLEVFRLHLRTANNGVNLTNEELFQFLRVFHLVGYDLEFPYGSTISLLASLIRPYGHSEVLGVLARIREEVAWHNQAAGTLTPANLPIDIRELFHQKVVEEIIPVGFSLQTSDFSLAEIPDDTAEALKFAALLGGWNLNAQGDAKVIEELISKK